MELCKLEAKGECEREGDKEEEEDGSSGSEMLFSCVERERQREEDQTNDKGEVCVWAPFQASE